MISDRDLVTVELPGSPYTFGTMPRAEAEAAIKRSYMTGWTTKPVPSCSCCGEPAWANRRCTKHQGRNPCAIEGCGRTAKAQSGQLGDDQVICAEHWRRYVPARSRARRAYLRHIARGKRLDWPDEHILAFHRFWDLLVRQIRRRAEGGHLDQREIERLFGWDG